jgi:hypothetical protein
MTKLKVFKLQNNGTFRNIQQETPSNFLIDSTSNFEVKIYSFKQKLIIKIIKQNVKIVK